MGSTRAILVHPSRLRFLWLVSNVKERGDALARPSKTDVRRSGALVQCAKLRMLRRLYDLLYPSTRKTIRHQAGYTYIMPKQGSNVTSSAVFLKCLSIVSHLDDSNADWPLTIRYLWNFVSAERDSVKLDNSFF